MRRNMYVTKLLSQYKNQPETLSLPPTEGPNSGYLVLQDEEYETECCCCMTIDSQVQELPFPQNKELTVSYGSDDDAVVFVPVINQPLSSNQYYVIKRGGRTRKGEAYRNSKEADRVPSLFGRGIQDVKPRPLNPSDVDQRVEIICVRQHTFSAKSVDPDGYPPNFLRRKEWRLRLYEPYYHLTGAQGLDIILRANFPDFNFSISKQSSESVVVGTWYCPFMFVREQGMKPKVQMKTTRYYKMKLEQKWVKIYAKENTGDETAVHVNVVVQTEHVSMPGGVAEAVWDEGNVEDGVIWYKSCDDDGGGGKRVGLSEKIVERIKWEEERIGWIGGVGRQMRVERVEEYLGSEKWKKFGCYMLVERFVLSRMDGSLVLNYEFKHANLIMCKWE